MDREYDITLVADEIQSGVGRTGKTWGSDHFAVEPDVITSAKALRVGATVSREEVFPAEKSRRTAAVRRMRRTSNGRPTALSPTPPGHLSGSETCGRWNHDCM